MGLNASETAYRVLARKYRPQNFSDLIGQEPMVRTLTNAFDMGRIAQAWMLTGVRGVGKTTTARILARALNYKTADTDRSTVRLEEFGEHCRAIMEGRHVDVVEMDAASHTGIDDIREIIEQVRYRPVSARYKVYIIDEVHMLSTQAFNGLLKTLEEPPPHVKFIFATTEIRKVPITVLSRCQRFDLRRVDSALLTRHLQKIVSLEGLTAEISALAMIARAGEGSVRDCLSILDRAIAHSGNAGTHAAASAQEQNENGDNGSSDKSAAEKPAIIQAETVRAMLGLADKAQIIDLFRLLMRGRVAEALTLLQHLYSYGAEPGIIIRELMDFNHLITRMRFLPAVAEDMSLSEEERSAAGLFSAKLSVRILSRNWQMLLKGLSETENSARPLAAAEMLLIRLCHAADLPDMEEALRILQQQNKQSGAAPVFITMQPSSVSLDTGDTAAESAETPPPATKSANDADTAPAAFSAQNTTAAPQAVKSAAEHAAAATETAESKEVEAADTQTQIPNSSQEQPLPPTAETAAPAVCAAPNQALRAIIAMADAQKNGKNEQLKVYLRENIRAVAAQGLPPIQDEPIIFRFTILQNALTNTPPDIARQIRDVIAAATGKKAIVESVNIGGGETIEEEEKRQEKELRESLKQQEDVAAVLRAFPQAELLSCREKEQNSDGQAGDSKSADATDAAE